MIYVLLVLDIVLTAILMFTAGALFGMRIERKRQEKSTQLFAEQMSKDMDVFLKKLEVDMEVKPTLSPIQIDNGR